MDLISGLNEQQREAVIAPDGATLVLAGPGSGKTRVLTHRIAHLIYDRNVAPYHIVSVTFTNKAAAEMKARVHNLIGHNITKGLRIGTFHAICAQILRMEAAAKSLPNYDKNYLIYDTDDQLKIVRRAVEDVGANIKRLSLTPYRILSRISDAKNELIQPNDYPRSEYMDEIIARIYERYQELLHQSNAMDFDDLIMQTVLLLQTNPEVRTDYQQRYKHVLVDEFQDTNMAQYALVKLWGAPQNNVFVVGDEDQAIYGFRGADYRNVMRFRQDYAGAKTILLEQNYRSTQTVLDAARSVIDRNQDRTPKALFTDQGGGAKIYTYEAFDEKEESQFIVKEIERLRIAGTGYDDIAVMYRTNAQSRALEDAFVDHRLPYQLIGGVGFYQRREVKDMLSYLRLIDSPSDSVSFDRVINVPKRGIGAKTQAVFQAWADEQGMNYGDGLLMLAAGDLVPDLSAGANTKLAAFGQMLAGWHKLAEAEQYGELMETIINQTDYHSYLAHISNSDDELADRQNNLAEIRGVLAKAEFESLSEFLTNTALSTDLDRATTDDNRVTLLTLHGSKGLEYTAVFITGLEDGLLPHSRSLDSPEGMAEERRLLYVGITRAKKRLYITRAFRRRGGQYYEAQEPSRFLYDLPQHLLEGSGSSNTQSRRQTESYYRASEWDAVPQPAPPRDEKIIPFPGPNVAQFKSGMNVSHSKFGEGTVIESRINGNDEEVTVAFQAVGIKQLMASFANLVKLNE